MQGFPQPVGPIADGPLMGLTVSGGNGMSKTARSGPRGDRLAFAGMAAILLLLTLFAVSAAWQPSRKAENAATASGLEQQYCDAGEALAVEQTREREYRRVPSAENLRSY